MWVNKNLEAVKTSADIPRNTTLLLVLLRRQIYSLKYNFEITFKWLEVCEPHQFDQKRRGGRRPRVSLAITYWSRVTIDGAAATSAAAAGRSRPTSGRLGTSVGCSRLSRRTHGTSFQFNCIYVITVCSYRFNVT